MSKENALAGIHCQTPQPAAGRKPPRFLPAFSFSVSPAISHTCSANCGHSIFSIPPRPGKRASAGFRRRRAAAGLVANTQLKNAPPAPSSRRSRFAPQYRPFRSTKQAFSQRETGRFARQNGRWRNPLKTRPLAALWRFNVFNTKTLKTRQRPSAPFPVFIHERNSFLNLFKTLLIVRNLPNCVLHEGRVSHTVIPTLNPEYPVACWIPRRSAG